MTFSDLQMTLRPFSRSPLDPPGKMLQKWSNILFSSYNILENICETHEFRGKITIFGGFAALWTPCSKSFQDKSAILYIFGIPRLRRISLLPLELNTTHLAASIGENVKKYLFLKFFTLTENRKNIVRFFDKNQKTSIYPESALFFLTFTVVKSEKSYGDLGTPLTQKMTKKRHK